MPPMLPTKVIEAMGSRDHRLRHYLWHGARDRWLSMTTDQQREFLYGNPGWEPPRPARDAYGKPIRDNGSGEDFLYMHRKMIEMVDGILADVHDSDYPKVTGWPTVPPPGDADYPVPVPFPEASWLDNAKTHAYYGQLADWERKYRSEEYLAGATLSEFGSDIETTIHNGMHRRWAAPSPVGYRDGSLSEPVDRRWDDPAYDFLADTYSSHVNPIFWRLHGWVDDRIEDWRRVHGVDVIEWKGTWLGPLGHHDHPMHLAVLAPETGRDELTSLERAVAILAEAGFDGLVKPPR